MAAAALVVGLLLVRSSSGGGNTGSAAGATAIVGSDFHSLAADPDAPGHLFAGGHTSVAESVDGGRTWRSVPSLAGADAMGWGWAGSDVYVSGHPGLSRSTDGAKSFSRANQGLPDTDVHAFGAGKNVLYAAGPSLHVTASTDGRRTWQQRSPQVGQSFFGRIVVDPGNDDHLFASDASAGVGESTDGGRTWRGVPAGLRSATWLSADRAFHTIAASGPDGAALSHDSGASWQPLRLPSGATLVEVTGAGDTLYVGTHSANGVTVQVSHDGGATWQRP